MGRPHKALRSQCVATPEGHLGLQPEGHVSLRGAHCCAGNGRPFHAGGEGRMKSCSPQRPPGVLDPLRHDDVSVMRVCPHLVALCKPIVGWFCGMWLFFFLITPNTSFSPRGARSVRVVSRARPHWACSAAALRGYGHSALRAPPPAAVRSVGSHGRCLSRAVLLLSINICSGSQPPCRFNRSVGEK